MKVKADRAILPEHHTARCKTCFRERSREALEDTCVLGSPENCTQGHAGSGPSNLAVLTLNIQSGITKRASWKSLLLPLFEIPGRSVTACEWGGRGKPMLVSRANSRQEFEPFRGKGLVVSCHR